MNNINYNRMSLKICIQTLCSFTEDTESNHRDLQVVEEEAPKPLSMEGSFTDKHYKYRYLIDSKDSGCPSIHSLMIEYDSNYNACNAKYKACFWSNAGVIIIVFGIAFVLFLCAVCTNKRRK